MFPCIPAWMTQSGRRGNIQNDTLPGFLSGSGLKPESVSLFPFNHFFYEYINYNY